MPSSSRGPTLGDDRRRVVVVDDNEFTRAGFASVLEGASCVDLVAAVTHGEALRWEREWRRVDVVIVDAADEGLAGDQFPGVEVVRRIRTFQGGRRPTVVVVTGHFLNDGLRYRMAQADADFFFFRANLRSADALVDVVVNPERQRRGVPPLADPQLPHHLGITERTRVEDMMTYINEQRLEHELDPDSPTREPRGRRWIRHRKALAQSARIEAVNLTTGMRPLGHCEPSWRQLRRLYGWAGRVRGVDDGLSKERPTEN